MLQSDYDEIKSFFSGCSQDFHDKLKKSRITCFLQDEKLESLDELKNNDQLIDGFIGMAQGDFVTIGQRFENPYNKYTFLEVVEYDFANDRVLLALRANE
jgi:hypothetical protein